MFDLIKDWIVNRGLEGWAADYTTWLVVAAATIILAFAANFIVKRVLLATVSRIIRRTRTTWDDALLEYRVLPRLAHIAPALVFYYLAGAFGGAEEVIRRAAIVYMVVVGGLTISAFLNAVIGVYRTMEVARHRPIKGYVQLVQIFVWVLMGIFVLSAGLNQNPTGLLTGLGAMTAVLLLVFKDSILGLVASFQIAGNDMVRLGDWIEMPKYNADGDVIDISLHTVKVQNWDKTISTIPAYALISDSFKNWRGMAESGGRRIKRSLYINMNSIRFCDAEMIERFSRFQYITEYVQRKKDELKRFNEENRVDTTYLVNGRHMTNVGTFRAYVAAYLRNHPKIHDNMTFLVRQLQPTEHGLPIEIYVFSNDQVWANYESIQADIFDHILAVVPLFDLQVFQNPSGADFRELSRTAH
ncbi:MAG: mechanosensitive ion channel family protein [candidate division Zixibacteria bacterium]|nr:mechanosensitive ion channel family protein [candidate division Zixibacteria bacterium]